MQLRNCLWVLICLCEYAQAQTINIYISPNGNDNHIGNLQNPFKTLNKALSFAKQFKGKKMSLQLRGGSYYLNKPIVLKQEDVVNKTLEIRAYKNEKVFISAGRLLPLKWTFYKDGIYQATVPKGISFERLYIDGALQQLARYPNYDSGSRVFHGTSADAISPQRTKTWKNPVGGYLHALQENEWGSLHYRITGVDNKGDLKLEGGWQNNRNPNMHKQYQFVENIFEELDAPGEWYLDKTEGRLYYWPSKNVDINNVTVEVSNLKNSIELRGALSKPVRNIQLKLLNFKHNERSFMDTKEPLLRSDWTIYRGAAVLFDGTENCNITDCSFIGIGGNAIMLSNYNRHDTISGCLIDNIGASAIAFVGDAKAVRSPLFKYEASISYKDLDKTAGPLNENFPQGCVATDNLIHDIGNIEKQSTGVEIEMSSSITVSHNSIYNTPRAGINIGDGCWGGHILEYNDVFNTVLETGDHGAFNSWGRDRYWNADRNYMDSLVAVHPELILLDAQKQNIIRNNRFRCDHGWDIDLDDGSSNYHIYNNVCLCGGLKLREGFYRVVDNNILINNSFHPHVWFNNSGDVFEHNIVMKQYFPIGINYWGNKINDNLFPDPASLAAAQKNGTDGQSMANHAYFINAVTGNYAVPASSSALKIGFENFAMDSFGVQKPSLKKMALHPIFSVLQGNNLSLNKSILVSFLGGNIKNVEGLGDRSAYGLPDETGVVVVAVGNELLFKSGLQNKDVISTVNGRPVKDIKSLLEIIKAENGKNKMPIELFRNQQLIKEFLFLK